MERILRDLVRKLYSLGRKHDKLDLIWIHLLIVLYSAGIPLHNQRQVYFIASPNTSQYLPTCKNRAICPLFSCFSCPILVATLLKLVQSKVRCLRRGWVSQQIGSQTLS